MALNAVTNVTDLSGLVTPVTCSFSETAVSMRITVHLPTNTSTVLEVESSNTINEVIAMTGLEPATHCLTYQTCSGHIFDNTWSLKECFISEGSELLIWTNHSRTLHKAIDDEAAAWDSLLYLDLQKQSLTYQLQREEKKVVKSPDYEQLCNAVRDVTNALNSAEERYAEIYKIVNELKLKQ